MNSHASEMFFPFRRMFSKCLVQVMVVYITLLNLNPEPTKIRCKQKRLGEHTILTLLGFHKGHAHFGFKSEY